MAERPKAFVAWMTETDAHSPFGGWDGPTLRAKASAIFPVPVVVTPLLPDDPKPGETWELDHWGGDRRRVTVRSPVVRTKGNDDRVAVTMGAPGEERAVEFVRVRHLRRPPMLKTYRLTFHDEGRGDSVCTPMAGKAYAEIKAENKDAAIVKLVEALEEV